MATSTSETPGVTGTKETSNVTGQTGDEEWTQDIVKGQTKDTTGPMGESVDSEHEGDLFPDQSGTLDTEAVGGGKHNEHKEDPTQFLTETIDTTTGGPIVHAKPKYRAPQNYPIVSGTKDTTGTDKPISDGEDIDLSNQWQSENLDTINQKITLQTTTDNVPGTPGSAPTVQATARGVRVTVPAMTNPTGAAIRGYRVEGSTGGVDFIEKDDLTTIVTTLVPSMDYKFRYQAVNDNGTGPFSPWSAAVKPLHPDEPGPGHATEVTVENRINPIYTPDGVVRPGTGGTTGRVATLVATGAAGSVTVNWTAPEYGTATGYDVRLSTGQTVSKGNVLTHTFTGVTFPSGTPFEVFVTPTNARGKGVPRKAVVTV